MVQIGAFLPITGPDISPEQLAAAAQTAESMGLGSVWTYERLLRPTEPIAMGGPGGPVMSAPPEWSAIYDPIEALTYVAAKTERILLGTSVLAALFHTPVVLARRLATLDHLSGGRLLAGIGQSWMEQEFTAAGVPMSRRGAGFEEHLEVMRAVWGSGPVRYDGRFYQVPESEIGPKPVRPGGPVALLGGGTPASLERAGRMGFGLATVIFSWDQVTDAIATVRNAATQAGHDAASLPISVQVNGAVSDGPPVDDRMPLTGSVEQVTEDLAELDRLGVDHVFWSMFEPDAQFDMLAQVQRAYRDAT